MVNSYYDALDDYLKDSLSESGRVHLPMKGAEFDDMSQYDREITTAFHFPFTSDDLDALEWSIEGVDLAAIPDFVEAQLMVRNLQALPLPSAARR